MEIRLRPTPTSEGDHNNTSCATRSEVVQLVPKIRKGQWQAGMQRLQVSLAM